MTDATDRFALPFIAPGQAQKELFHNEALAQIDAALHPAVGAIGETVPPPAPTPGDCRIVGTDATGAWAGHDNAIAAYTAGGWRFVVPTPGMTAWAIGAGLPARWDGVAWRIGEIAAARVTVGGVGVVGAQQPAINPPSGGSIVDAEARAVLSAILAALSAHGLIGT